MKQKITNLLVLIACLTSLFGAAVSQKASAATFSTKAECATNVTTINATAPSSITIGAPFTISGITSSSSAPNGITVSKIVSTSTLTNAVSNGSTTVTGVWTGSATGTFTISFPNVPVTPTGAAGSQIKLTLTSIALYINGNVTTPIVTCDKAGGQLTANKTGESLTILSIGITAPVNTPAPTPTPTTASPTPGNSTPSPSTTSASPTPGNSTPSPATPQSTSNNSSATAGAGNTSSKTQGQSVTITVVDSAGKPLGNVPVIVDNGPQLTTDDRGMVTLNNLSAGEHKVAVLGKQTKVSRTIKVAGSGDPIQLTVQLKHQIISPILAALIGLGIFLLAILAVYFFVRHHRHKKLSAHFATPPTAAMATNPATVGLGNIVTNQTDLNTQTNPPPTASISPTTQATSIIQPAPVPTTIPNPVPVTLTSPSPAPLPITPQSPGPVMPHNTIAPSQPGQVFTPETPTPMAPNNTVSQT